jgi:hypothetical protein
MQAVDETEGPCYKCGEPGHRAATCRQDEGRCTARNKKGHKEAICWQAHPELKPDCDVTRGPRPDAPWPSHIKYSTWSELLYV